MQNRKTGEPNTAFFFFRRQRHSPSGPFGFSGADGRFFRLFVETAGTGKRVGPFVSLPGRTIHTARLPSRKAEKRRTPPAPRRQARPPRPPRLREPADGRPARPEQPQPAVPEHRRRGRERAAGPVRVQRRRLLRRPRRPGQPPHQPWLPLQRRGSASADLYPAPGWWQAGRRIAGNRSARRWPRRVCAMCLFSP